MAGISRVVAVCCLHSALAKTLFAPPPGLARDDIVVDDGDKYFKDNENKKCV